MAKDLMTDKQMGDYLNSIRANGMPATARKIAGVTQRMVDDTIFANEDFAEQLEDAMEYSADILEAEARRRAVEGYEKDVWYKGEYVGSTTEYSDTLLMALLKAHRPEKFRDNLKLSGDKNEPLTITVRDIASEQTATLTPEVVREVAQTAIINSAIVPSDDDPYSLA